MTKNKLSPKKILIISYFSNEDGMACAHHVDDRLSIFKEMGVEPVLLTSLCVPKWETYTHYRVPSLSPSGLRFELRRFFRRKGKNSLLWKLRNIILLPLLPLYGLERMFVRIDTIWYWLPLAYLKGKWIMRHHDIDCIYSTGGPAVAHSVALRLTAFFNKKYDKKIQWLAEVQDPLIHSYCANTDQELKLLHKVERETYANADRMIFLTRQAMMATEKRLSLSGNGKVIYPGAIPAQSKKNTNPSTAKLTLAHFGSLGGVRNLEPLIKGLQLALTEQPEMIDSVRIDLYGGTGDDDQERIAYFSHPSLFSIKGRVTRHAALDAMNQCDILLLIQGKDPISTETIPSKLYEYLHIGCAVLALVHENPEIKQMIEPLGHTCVSMEPEEIAPALITLYDQWRNGVLAESHPSTYTVKKAVAELLRL